MRISDWSSDVCSSDLSTANTARPACPNLSLRAGREGDEAIEQLPARKHLSGERRYGEQRIAAAQQFGEEQKRRRPRCRHFFVQCKPEPTFKRAGGDAAESRSHHR